MVVTEHLQEEDLKKSQQVPLLADGHGMDAPTPPELSPFI